MATQTQIHRYTPISKPSHDIQGVRVVVNDTTPHIVVQCRSGNESSEHEFRSALEVQFEKPISSQSLTLYANIDTPKPAQPKTTPGIALVERTSLLVGRCHSIRRMSVFERCMQLVQQHHRLQYVHDVSALAGITKAHDFGGAWIDPPVSPSSACQEPLTLSEAALMTGQVDIIVPSSCFGKFSLVADNIMSSAIQSTLNLDGRKSINEQRSALILATSESQAVAAIFAVSKLKADPIYTIGFQVKGPMASKSHRVRHLEELRQISKPIVMINALRGCESNVIEPLLRHFGKSVSEGQQTTQNTYVDLSNTKYTHLTYKLDITAGWTVFDKAHVEACVMTEVLRSLTGQHMQFDLVSHVQGANIR